MNKKPFGLHIACSVAYKVIQQALAPMSVVIANLIKLKESNTFPLMLEADYFKNNKVELSEEEKKEVARILDVLKKPHFDMVEVLENIFQSGWVIKKGESLKYNSVETENKGVNSKKKVVDKKTIKPKSKKRSNKEIAVPTVTIKKPKKTIVKV